LDAKERDSIINDTIKELSGWSKEGLTWLNQMWRDNHGGLHDAMGCIYELAVELARHRRQIDV